MSTKQILFFAERSDLQYILDNVETSNNISYSEAGVFDIIDIPTYNSHKEMHNLGKVNNGDWNHNKFYIVHGKEEIINKRIVSLKTNGVRYAVYQDTNQRTIIFKPGGIFEDGVLVAGSLGTISEEPFSIKLYNQYSKIIKKSFVKVGAFYLSLRAKEKLDNGWRLVTNVKSPIEYDLKSD